MKVYIVYRNDDDGMSTEINKVFDTKEKARRYLKDLAEGEIENEAECFSDPDDYSIECYTDDFLQFEVLGIYWSYEIIEKTVE